MKLSLILGAMALAVVLAFAASPGPISLAVIAMAIGLALVPIGRRMVLIALSISLFGVIDPALAQAATTTEPGFMVSTVLPVLLPVALTVGGIFVPVIGTMIWVRISAGLDTFQKLSGVQIDAEHREALHSAIDTGLKLAFAHGAPALEATLAGHLAAGRLGDVSSWVEKSVPGAIAHLGVTRELLDGLTTARLSDSLASAVAAPLALPGAILGGLAGVIAPAAVPTCLVCGTADPNAVCTRTDCPDAQPAASSGG